MEVTENYHRNWKSLLNELDMIQRIETTRSDSKEQLKLGDKTLLRLKVKLYRSKLLHSISNMNKKLTMYIIEQEEQIKDLSEEIDKLNQNTGNNF